MKKFKGKIKLGLRSKYTDKYFELLCDIFFKKYGLTRIDILNKNGGQNFIISKAKGIICFILRSEKKYSLGRTGKILNTSHSHIYCFLRTHKKRIENNEFGYKEMFTEVLAAFLYEVSKIKTDLTCNPCVVIGFEKCKEFKQRKNMYERKC